MPKVSEIEIRKRVTGSARMEFPAGTLHLIYKSILKLTGFSRERDRPACKNYSCPFFKIPPSHHFFIHQQMKHLLRCLCQSSTAYGLDELSILSFSITSSSSFTTADSITATIAKATPNSMTPWNPSRNT